MRPPGTVPLPYRGRLRPVDEADVRLCTRTVHGYRRAYRIAGQGPALLLIHGIGDSSATWIDLIPDVGDVRRILAGATTPGTASRCVAAMPE